MTSLDTLFRNVGAEMSPQKYIHYIIIIAIFFNNAWFKKNKQSAHEEAVIKHLALWFGRTDPLGFFTPTPTQPSLFFSFYINHDALLDSNWLQ